MAVLDIDPVAFDEMRDSLRQVFRQGGREEMSDHQPPVAIAGVIAAAMMASPRLPGISVSEAAVMRIRFDTGNPRAEAAIRQLGGGLIREIDETTREAVRDRIEAGIAAGENPRVIARTIVGVTDRKTGERVGGIVGLTQAQAQWSRGAGEELSRTPPDRAYFRRRARDRRYDVAVRRAIQDDKPLDANMREKITRRYRDRLLRLRGEMIARTEVTAALNAGRYEAIQQIIDTGAATVAMVSGTWDTAVDGRERPDHRAMNGQTRTFGDPFVAPDGSLLRYPGDSGLGANADQVVNCRCYAGWKVDWIGQYRRRAA